MPALTEPDFVGLSLCRRRALSAVAVRIPQRVWPHLHVPAHTHTEVKGAGGWFPSALEGDERAAPAHTGPRRRGRRKSAREAGARGQTLGCPPTAGPASLLTGGG